MKLISLKLNARGVNGWESQTLEFGERTTSLHAPNGSGKTPIVQAIPFCLGFDAKFQNDIIEKCHSATLVLEEDGKSYKFTRDFGTFRLSVETASGEKEFFSEGDFSKALFQEFNLTIPTLVGVNRQATHPYLSCLLPIFYVRQIGGYEEPYRYPSPFITDQFVEMIRFAFGLTPKRSYLVQKDLLAARDQLDADQRRIVYQQKILSDLSARVEDSVGVRENLVQQTALLNTQISDLRNSADAAGAASDVLAELLHSKEKRIRTIRQQHSDLKARINGISSIRSEIEGEIQTLSLNEESKRVFESFFDICGRADCGLFVSSSASYAKNLMYLKDQLKDLEANSNRAETQIAFLEENLVTEESELNVIAAKHQQRNNNLGTSQLVSAVQSLTRELFDKEQQLAKIDQLAEERKKYFLLENARNKTQDRIATLSNNGRQDLEFNSLRTKIQKLTSKWMDILRTPNASREVEIDLDFKFRFGKQSIDVFNGSTRSRIILSIHAALFELYLAVPERPFRFLILDTPKQHELATEDLARYLRALEDICDELNGQILISSTEYRHTIREIDKEWTPQFSGPEQNMYLGNHSNKI